MKELDNYIINYETLLIIPCEEDDRKVKVYELDDEFIVCSDVLNIVKSSCLYFGSSFEGRKQGTKNMLNCEIKVPIIVEDSKNLIIFPTSSFRNKKTIWISYNCLLGYEKCDKDSTMLKFKNNNNLKIKVKYNIVDNQVIRCLKLNTFVNKRKKILNGEKM